MYEQQNLEFMKQIEEECRKNKEIHAKYMEDEMKKRKLKYEE